MCSMTENRVIPEAFREQVLAMPEYSRGVTRIRLRLADGSRFSDVFVAWGTEVVKVGASEGVPFDPSEIVAVEGQ